MPKKKKREQEIISTQKSNEGHKNATIKKLIDERDMLLKRLNSKRIQTATTFLMIPVYIAIGRLLLIKMTKNTLDQASIVREMKAAKDNALISCHDFKQRSEIINPNYDTEGQIFLFKCFMFLAKCITGDELVRLNITEIPLDDVLNEINVRKSICNTKYSQERGLIVDLINENLLPYSEYPELKRISNFIYLPLFMLLKVGMDKLILYKNVHALQANPLDMTLSNKNLQLALENEIKQLRTNLRTTQKSVAYLLFAAFLMLAFDHCFNEDAISPEVSFIIGGIFFTAMKGMVEIGADAIQSVKNGWNDWNLAANLPKKIKYLEEIFETLPEDAQPICSMHLGKNKRNESNFLMITFNHHYCQAVPRKTLFKIIKGCLVEEGMDPDLLPIYNSYMVIPADIDLTNLKRIQKNVYDKFQECNKLESLRQQITQLVLALYPQPIRDRSYTLTDINVDNITSELNFIMDVPEHLHEYACLIANYFELNNQNISFIEALKCIFPENKISIYEASEIYKTVSSKMNDMIIMTGSKPCNDEDFNNIIKILDGHRKHLEGKRDYRRYSSFEQQTQYSSDGERKYKSKTRGLTGNGTSSDDVKNKKNSDIDDSNLDTDTDPSNSERDIRNSGGRYTRQSRSNSLESVKEEPFRFVLTDDQQNRGILATSDYQPSSKKAFFEHGNWKDEVNRILSTQLSKTTCLVKKSVQKEANEQKGEEIKESHNVTSENEDTVNEEKKETVEIVFPAQIDRGWFPRGFAGSGKGSKNAFKLFGEGKGELKSDQADRVLYEETGEKEKFKDNIGNEHQISVYRAYDYSWH